MAQTPTVTNLAATVITCITLLLILIFDIWAWLNIGQHATLSACVYQMGHRWPIIAVAVGIVVGHLLPVRPLLAGVFVGWLFW